MAADLDRRSNSLLARLRRAQWVPSYCRSCGARIRTRRTACASCDAARP